MRLERTDCYCDRCNKTIQIREHDDNRIVVYPKKGLFGMQYEVLNVCNDCLQDYMNFIKLYIKGDE